MPTRRQINIFLKKAKLDSSTAAFHEVASHFLQLADSNVDEAVAIFLDQFMEVKKGEKEIIHLLVACAHIFHNKSIAFEDAERYFEDAVEDFDLALHNAVEDASIVATMTKKAGSYGEHSGSVARSDNPALGSDDDADNDGENGNEADGRYGDNDAGFCHGDDGNGSSHGAVKVPSSSVRRFIMFRIFAYDGIVL